jgi:hypothetical protein
MKSLVLLPVLMAGLALPAAAGGTSPEPGNTGAPAKVEITPAPGAAKATAAATVTTETSKSKMDQSIVDYSDLGGGRGCGHSKTQALIN